MFEKFKKKKTLNLFAPVDGELQDLTKVPDPVFAQKMMGEGFAVMPSAAEIYSPVTGEVTSIFKTKHAISLKSPAGLEVLVHIGLDTVGLNGGPFSMAVKEGDSVTKDTLLATADFAAIKEAGKNEAVLVVLPNGKDLLDQFALRPEKDVVHGEEVADLKLK
ncbi:PTS glucose transporter subunit IIA [Enterococcus hirae]|jgi:glucose-specific phosphotransferase system IIA component|nr:PTS glucose transporter subunit IIA [Enterococcaceae bacterium]MCI1919321.1 PTS glucose transporter subunit IIA [Enterococcaceae bacterium]MDM8213901.1 PTS glucose transporter subunit IIA [Enterococcus hirae]